MDIEWTKSHEFAEEASVGRIHMVLEQEDERDISLWLAFGDIKPEQGPAWSDVESFTSFAEAKRAAADLVNMFQSFRAA